MRTNKIFILACLHPPRSPTREAVCRSSGKTRHGAYLKYTQNIMLQHQGEDPTGKPTPLICSTNPTAVSLRRLQKNPYWRYHQPIDRERAHSCHPSTAKRGPKGIPRDTIFLLTGRRRWQTCGSENQRR
ncbi:hypothetical protein TNCV_2917141 [Trichonephila clavipes]|nr:hypothetical protein TNCV_2917141 [Trichonephila clavipes]